MLAHAQLEIVTPLEGEFLIGDSPAVSLRYRTLLGNTVFGVALGDANTVVLPLGPRYLIALARKTRTFKVPRSVVDELNTIQIRGGPASRPPPARRTLAGFIQRICASLRRAPAAQTGR